MRREFEQTELTKLILELLGAASTKAWVTKTQEAADKFKELHKRILDEKLDIRLVSRED